MEELSKRDMPTQRFQFAIFMINKARYSLIKSESTSGVLLMRKEVDPRLNKKESIGYELNALEDVT